MIKRLIFATGFGVGFVAGSASGRKSYESLKQNALKTWQDPKVQEKVSEGAEWVKSEAPGVGGKLSGSAKKASDALGSKASEASSTAKDKTQGSSSDNDSSGGESSGNESSGSGDAQPPEPVTTDSPMDPAEPKPTGGDQS